MASAVSSEWMEEPPPKPPPPPPAGDDGPLAAHDGDGVAARAGAFALLAEIFAELDDLGALARAALDGDLGLLDLTHLVDQLVGKRLFGRIGAGLDQGLQRRGRGLAILGGVGQGRIVDGGHPGGHGLAVGAGVIALGVFVDGVLVFVALFELGLHAVFLEGAAQEQAVGREAGRLEAGGVLHPQFGRRGPDHIGRHHRAGGGEALAVGDDRLAGVAEAVDGLAQFVGRGRGHAAFGQADQHGLDAGVALRLVQAVDHLGQGQARTAEGRERIGRGLIGDAAAQIQLQHRIDRDRRLGRRGDGDRQQNHGHDDHEQDQPGEDTQDRQEELLHRMRKRAFAGRKWPGQHRVPWAAVK